MWNLKTKTNKQTHIHTHTHTHTHTHSHINTENKLVVARGEMGEGIDEIGKD